MSAFKITPFSILPACAALLFVSCSLFSSKDDGGDSSSRGYYNILSPGDQSNVIIGSTAQILWASGNKVSDTQVSIALYQDSTYIQDIASMTANNGAFFWVVDSMEMGFNYKIRIQSYSDSSQWDFSHEFAITPAYYGTYAISSPASNFQATLSSSLNIAWTSTGKPGQNVTLSLYKDTVRVGTIASSTANDGNYTWNSVTSALGAGSGYTIRIASASDPSLYAKSYSFVIISPYNGTITATSSPDTLDIGNSFTITWGSTGSPGTSIAIDLMIDSSVVLPITSSTANDGVYSWSVPQNTPLSDAYRIRISSAQDGGIFGLTATFMINGVVLDSYEPDSTRETATPLNPGETQNHNVIYQDVDWYKFQAESGKGYIIANTGTRIYKYLYSSSSTSYLNYYSYSSPNLWTAPGTGTFYIRVIPYSTSYTGDYTLTVTPLDSLRSPFTIPEDTLLQAGASFNITWAPDSGVFGSSVRLYLYRDSVQVASVTTSTANDGSHIWTLPAGFPTDSSYSFRMTSYSSSSVFAHSLPFIISGVDPDPYESDNVQIDAKTILLDGSVQNRSLTYQDVDWIQFYGQADSVYIINITGGLQMRTYVQTSAGSQMAYSSSTNPTLIFTPTLSQTYYVRVNYYSSSYYGSYNISISELNEATSQNLIQFTTPNANSVWTAGAAHSIQWDTAGSPFGTSVSLALYKGPALIQTIASSTLNDGLYDWTVLGGLLTDGDYSIRITNYPNQEFYASSRDFTINGVSADTYEPDNTPGSASVLPATGVSLNRSLSYSDVDWMSFTAEAGINYYVKTSGNLFIDMVLMDENLVTLDNTSATDPGLVLANAVPGTYYLRMDGPDFGAYQINLRSYTPDSLITFINPNSSTTMATGVPYSIQWVPDSAFFGGTVSFYLYQNGESKLNIGNALYFSGTRTLTIPDGFASGSNYQIRMQTGGGDFFAYSSQFTISGMVPDAYEPDDNAATASPLLFSVPRNHNLTYTDEDWAQFAGQVDHYYKIQTVQSPTLRTNTQLTSDNGANVILSSLQSSSDSTNELRWFCSVAGNYKIRTLGLYTGAYVLEVTEFTPSQYRYQILAPDSGAVLTMGSTVTLQWTSQVNTSEGNVDLFLYNSNGVAATIQANTPNLWSYDWTVPAGLAPDNDYTIRVISLINSRINGTSQVFTIN